MTDEELGWIVSSVAMAIVYIGTAIIARKKGRRWPIWLILSFVFSFFATIVLLFLPNLNKSKNTRISKPASKVADESRDMANALSDKKDVRKSPTESVEKEVVPTAPDQGKKMTMKITLSFQLTNSDSYETDHCAIDASIHDPATLSEAAVLLENLDVEILESFVRRIFSNPNFDGSESEGELLSVVAPQLCQRAFKKLGWSEVTAAISSITIGKDSLSLSSEDLTYLLSDTLALQLIKDESTMYFYN